MFGTAIVNKLEFSDASLETHAEGVRVVFEGGDLVLLGARVFFEDDHIRVEGSPKVLRDVVVRFYANESSYNLEESELELKQLIEAQPPKRRQVLKLMIQGFSDREIAKLLDLTPNTIGSHKARMADTVTRVNEIVGKS